MAEVPIDAEVLRRWAEVFSVPEPQLSKQELFELARDTVRFIGTDTGYAKVPFPASYNPNRYFEMSYTKEGSIEMVEIYADGDDTVELEYYPILEPENQYRAFVIKDYVSNMVVEENFEGYPSVIPGNRGRIELDLYPQIRTNMGKNLYTGLQAALDAQQAAPA